MGGPGYKASMLILGPKINYYLSHKEDKLRLMRVFLVVVTVVGIVCSAILSVYQFLTTKTQTPLQGWPQQKQKPSVWHMFSVMTAVSIIMIACC